MVAIVSASLTQFGKRRESLFDLAKESSLPILRSFRDDIDFVVVSNSYSGEFNGVSGLNNLVTTYLSLDYVPSIRVDNTSGSGGSSVLVAKSLLDSGIARSVLVIGVEKMSTLKTRDVTSVISSLLPPRERSVGISVPSLASLMAKIYMEKYGAKREAIAQVAVKNHRNGAKNPYAHIRKEVSLDDVLSSTVVADPLTQFEFCPISDGSASILMVRDQDALSFTSKPVYIKGVAMGSDSSHITDRENLLEMRSVRIAGEKARRMSGVTRFDFAELHDMATILEIVEGEALGLLREGEGWKYYMEGETDIDGEIPINTSGGLNSKGHPIGASGVAQLVESFLQVRGEAGDRQVKNARVGLSLSMAGFGNSATVTIVGDEP
ncbi:thiolase family protein [Metallosphaera hakonensis]|uniref:Acetyl-CoA acetyltransferase n=1 Tax=Metallosphaera hakonensis JCM 8857 = DSM 7519 TaxID=1293036 RepID=A0A2U9IWI6_9CREN|nr:thiolase family protein [Metallosphaera hakonensis]AWS00323.1 thiolase family protein [Metallosphaera hakonensis JCM 8857 = DSM 7519]